MVERTATIVNSAGIHCRPSAAIVKDLNGYAGDITLATAEGSCDPRSIMELLALCLQEGTAVRVRVEGPDEVQVADRLVTLLETHFDFPPRLAGEDTRVLLKQNRPGTGA